MMAAKSQHVKLIFIKSWKNYQEAFRNKSILKFVIGY